MAKLKSMDLPIEGMHCASCVLSVNKTFQRIEGVDEVDADLASNTLHITVNPKKISYDEMEAYLLLPTPLTPDEEYDFADVMEKVRNAGVKIGINESKISAMIQERYFDRECLIAKGIDVVNGVDAYFDFNFDTNFNKVPNRRDDGTVDYWSIHSIELVEEGQIIAEYVEPTGEYREWLLKRFEIYKALYPAVKDKFLKLKEM